MKQLHASSMNQGCQRPSCASRSKHLPLRQKGRSFSAIGAAASGTGVRRMTASFKELRSSMEEDESLKVLMAGLRGTNIDSSDFAGASVRMNLVEVQRSADDTETLPLVYEPDQISSYWGRRPVSVITRIFQLLGIAGGFLGKLAIDAATGRLKETEVDRAIDLRNIMTSLGPAYIKLGQALSIRPDLLSPAAMNELQKLCDKVPSFPTDVAMGVIREELGRPHYEVFAELTPEPIAAASLGQVYKGRLKTGEVVAVKVQRLYVLETVTVDLFIIRSIGLAIRQYAPELTTRADLVALLDEWAARFFEELDYVKEGQNAMKFAEQMKYDLPQVVVPKTYSEYTSRRVLTTEWLEGEKLSQSQASDVGTLVNVGVICYLKQLLDTGFFHADPHPGNLIRTPDGRLAVLDFGLMTQVDDNIKFGMIEAISHLIHRDYEAIVKDFVTLDFIPPGTDLRPILPVLARVFDRALEGGGAKNINFQDLAADLAQITFDYPFRIPPYFALIIRAISTLEGIALVGNPDFAIVDEAFPYIARRLLTDDTPRLREALRYMVYGKSGVFDADRLIDLLVALEDFQLASTSARGDMDLPSASPPLTSSAGQKLLPPPPSNTPNSNRDSSLLGLGPSFPFPSFPFPTFPLPTPSFSTLGPLGLPVLDMGAMGQMLNNALQGTSFAEDSGMSGLSSLGRDQQQQAITLQPSSMNTREAFQFMLSSDGTWFRSFIMEELVKSVDALSRDQAFLLCSQLGIENLPIPILLPGVRRSFIPLATPVSEEDKIVVENVLKITAFLAGTSNSTATTSDRPSLQPLSDRGQFNAGLMADLVPVLPTLAREVIPELTQRLASRVTARLVRELLM